MVGNNSSKEAEVAQCNELLFQEILKKLGFFGKVARSVLDVPKNRKIDWKKVSETVQKRINDVSEEVDRVLNQLPPDKMEIIHPKLQRGPPTLDKSTEEWRKYALLLADLVRTEERQIVESLGRKMMNKIGKPLACQDIILEEFMTAALQCLNPQAIASDICTLAQDKDGSLAFEKVQRVGNTPEKRARTREWLRNLLRALKVAEFQLSTENVAADWLNGEEDEEEDKDGNAENGENGALIIETDRWLRQIPKSERSRWKPVIAIYSELQLKILEMVKLLKERQD